MIHKGLAVLAALLALPVAFGQASHPSAPPQTAPSAPSAAPQPQSPASVAGAPGDAQAIPGANPSGTAGTPASTAAPTPRTDCLGGNCDEQLPHISIATPAPAPAPWPWQQRIAWGANIVLLVLGYAAVLIALSLLRKIERQTRYSEAAADAAKEAAQAALAQTQALTRAERPWVLVSVRHSHTDENGFNVIATNRGRGPARVLTTVDEIVSAADESRLAAAPEYRNQPAAPQEPMILLPGETTQIHSFSRADVKRICQTEERLARVEKWEEKIFLYGTMVYRDLAAADDAPTHETSWFCWYIHGRQKSGMVMAGPPSYNRHT